MELKEIKDLNEQRRIYNNYLISGGMQFFNNGDPVLYNSFSMAYFNAIYEVKRRQKLKEMSKAEFYKGLVRRPIELVKEIQKNYYHKHDIVVGGKIHSVVMNSEGEFFE